MTETGQRIVTETLLEMNQAIEEENKAEFLQLLHKNSLRLHNCTCGDSYNSQLVSKVYRKALETFLV